MFKKLLFKMLQCETIINKIFVDENVSFQKYASEDILIWTFIDTFLM